MKKKFLAGAVTLLSVLTLAACSQSTNKDTDIVTMKGDTITVSEFYEQVKNNTAAQQVLLNMTIQDVFEKKYGDKVSEKEVKEAFEENKKSYGAAFPQILAQAGLTEESYHAQIRTSKLVEYAVKKAAEKEINDDAYKAAYDAYTPEVTAQVIKLDSEDKAKEVLEKAKAEGADFGQIAKENSTDAATKEKGGEIKFDSGSTTLPDDVKKAAFALEPNGISEVITAKASAYTNSYYIIKLNSKSEKKEKWEDYKDRLKEIILTQKQNDASFIQKIVAEELKAANLKVKDAAFQNVFAQYMNAGADTSSSSEASSESSSK
ncbi:peptidylprolyl isomerase PrsA [Streptococcus pneumoniae]